MALHFPAEYAGMSLKRCHLNWHVCCSKTFSQMDAAYMSLICCTKDQMSVAFVVGFLFWPPIPKSLQHVSHRTLKIAFSVIYYYVFVLFSPEFNLRND